MMKIKHNLIFDERGISSLEFVLTFTIIMLMIMSIYDVLKFQNDMGMVFYNEQIAKHRIDFSYLEREPEKIASTFNKQLNEANANDYFSSLEYSNINMRCYNSLDLKYDSYCKKNTKIIRFTYQVRRKFTDNFISQFLNLPLTFEREVYVVNDYYN